MKQLLLVWPVFLVYLYYCSLHLTASIDEAARSSLISFLGALSNNNTTSSVLNWSATSDPCWGGWDRVGCDHKNASVTQLYLQRLNLSGTLTIGPLCRTPTFSISLSILILDGNNISGEILPDISNCAQLTRLHLSGNRLSGIVPDSFASLKNLKKLDFSFNNFSGKLPDLGRVSGLRMFLAQNNRFSGKIPELDFSNLGTSFNVSYNNLTGRIPKSARIYFGSDSFVGNPLLCGAPLRDECPKGSGTWMTGHIFVYVGYILLGLVLVGLITYKMLVRRPRTIVAGKTDRPVNWGNDGKVGSREYHSGALTLEVVSSATVNGFPFEDLLRAPAELMGSGKHGRLYKVVCENGTAYAVKRIKDWGIGSEEFKRRMERVGQRKHRNVLTAAAFYSSVQDKLLVYHFQPNGSLFQLLHGIRVGCVFDWVTRLNLAANVAEAVAFMHQNLRDPDIPHGNLKSSNILFDKNMEPYVSEYGLIDMSGETNNQDDFQTDVNGFGVILLELLTGKLVQNESDITKWLVREDWTVEAFDKSLIQQGASIERMMRLLQIALKCVNPTAEARPTMSEVASLIKSLKEDDDASIAYDSSTSSDFADYFFKK